MFSGNYTAKVDGSGRFTFPAKQLAQLDDERIMYVMIGMLDSCLWLMPKPYWDKFLDSVLKNKNPFSPTDMALRRQYLGNSFDTEIESNSRIVIPQLLLTRIGVTDRCVIVGVGDFFEIWEPVKFIEREKHEAATREKAVRELGGPTKF